MRGKFIVFEGIDGAGKTTQIEKLKEALLPGTLFTKETSTGPTGVFLSGVLKWAHHRGLPPDDPELHVLPYLFAADRADHLATVIEPALADGTSVVCDRYVLTSLAYQSLSHSFIEITNLNAAFREADLTIFLKVSPEEAVRRIESRAEQALFEKKGILKQVAQNYDLLLNYYMMRMKIIEFDGMKDPDVLHSEILKHLDLLGVVK